MKKNRKWWIGGGVLLLLVIAAGVWTTWQGKAAEPAYKTAKIEQGAITASVSASGTLSPVVSVQVGSQVSGQLKEIHVDFNSEVKQGQLLARIDPESFEYRVRQAQADLDAARSQVMTQQAQIAASRAQAAQVEVNFAEARRELEQKQQLVEKGFISSAERDKAQAVHNALAEQVKAARAQVQVAEAGAANARAAVTQREAVLAQAKVELERTAIRAPVNGIVIKRSVERGQTVAASLQAPELFIIAENLADMRVDTSVDEAEIGRIRPGQKASFTVDAFPGRTFEGTVNQVRKAAQNVSNVVTYMVEVSAPNPRKELLPGMTANVRIVTDTRADVLKVPNAALRFRPAAGAAGAGAAASPQKASTDSAPAAPAGGAAQGRAMRERLEKELALDDSQKAKLDTIFSSLRDKMMSAREAPAEDRQKLIERHRQDMRMQIMDILNPEQKKKYEAIVAESGERRGATTRGRVYLPGADKQLKELEVRLGLTDGTMTEVISSELKEGMEVVTGAAQAANADKRPRQPAGPRMF